MSEVRKIYSVQKSRTTMEGAGVRLKRAFGQAHPKLDPFLLLDDFGSENPEDYIAGFPWHPHRGIETITYMLHGKILHEDSLGNSGTIGPGDVQWMTAGSGIVHQELPEQTQRSMSGYQLWANLPASHKMMKPRYRDITVKDIPEVTLNDFIKVKIICGEIQGVKGPVQDIITEPEYLDVSMNHHSIFKHKIDSSHNAFAYVIEGEGFFDYDKQQKIGEGNLIIFDDGDEVQITTEANKLRFLLISGKPIKEPVAWAGPIVMNTQDEIRIAFEEYRNGTFIRTNE